MRTEASLQIIAKKILRVLGERAADLDIILLPDAEMRKMKWRLLRKRTEPNVISLPEPFRFPHPETKKRFLGEVYLNRDILRKQPERSAPLLLHGMLHLLGYDHIEDEDARFMEHREAEILAKIGK